MDMVRGRSAKWNQMQMENIICHIFGHELIVFFRRQMICDLENNLKLDINEMKNHTKRNREQEKLLPCVSFTKKGALNDDKQIIYTK